MGSRTLHRNTTGYKNSAMGVSAHRLGKSARQADALGERMRVDFGGTKNAVKSVVVIGSLSRS
jgi:hypothetical protein